MLLSSSSDPWSSVVGGSLHKWVPDQLPLYGSVAISESLWMISQFTQWHCQPIFFCLRSPLLPKVFHWSIEVEGVWVPVTCVHATLTLSSSRWLGGLPMSLFLVSWCLAVRHFLCSLRRGCPGRSCSISFLIIGLFAVILLSKIADIFRRSIQATAFSLVSSRCSWMLL